VALRCSSPKPQLRVGVSMKRRQAEQFPKKSKAARKGALVNLSGNFLFGVLLYSIEKGQNRSDRPASSCS
jgi:hypothetical protein